MEEVVNESRLKRDRRLAVDDLAIQCLQDGTFNMATVVSQDDLPADQHQPKILDRTGEDLSGDPFYRSLMVKVYPEEAPVQMLTKDLALIDRNLKVGQLVKRGSEDVGYVRSIAQTASARIWHSDENVRSDLSRELYIFKKPAEYFGQRPLEIGDIVELYGWLGPITDLSNFLDLTVTYNNNGASVTREAHCTDHGLFSTLNTTGINKVNTFALNRVQGLFPGRTLSIPYTKLVKMSSFRFTTNASGTELSEESEIPVNINITSLKLHMITVNWKTKIPGMPEAPVSPPGRAPYAVLPPGKNVKNDADRHNLRLVSHKHGLKVGDICQLNEVKEEDWTNLMAKWTWQNTVAKDYFLHRRRHKRPRLAEGSKEVLPQKPYPKNAVVEIVLTTTKAEVEWINSGIVEGNIDSRDLVPVRYRTAFPGAIVYDENHRFTDIVAVGPANARTTRYSVLQSASVTKTRVTYDNPDGLKTKWIVQVYTLQPGAHEPVPLGQPKELPRKTQFVGLWNVWHKNDTKVVTRMPGSHAPFTYGNVIGCFPDGRIRLKLPNGTFLAVWPVDIVALTKFQVTQVTHDFGGW